MLRAVTYYQTLFSFHSMNTFIRGLAVTATFALLMGSVAAPFATYAADEPTLVASQTVANVTAGSTNTQSNATTSTTANVAEVKANLVLNVGAAPAAAESITVGSCVVSFATTTAGVGAQDLNCTDNAATIRTATTTSDIAKTAVQIAADLATLTNATSTGHGALTVAVGTTTSKVSFTTTNTEASATPIGFTDSTTGDIVSYVSTTGVIPVAQVWTVTPANVEAGDVFTTIINGTTVSYTSTSTTVAGVTFGLAAAINANSTVALAVTAADQTTRIDVTSDTAGTPFTITSSATNRAAVAQTVTFTPTGTMHAEYTVIINGVPYTYTSPLNDADTTAQTIVEGLNSLLASNTDVTCSEDNVKVTCVAAVAGTSFTYSSSAASLESSGGGSSHHSSGGGSSHSSSGSSTVNHGTTVATPAAPAVAHANANAAFLRDLTVGATGTDVTALQMYLNAHGSVLAATGPGSVGNETMTFGGLTKAALMKFQAAHGILPSAGYFGPKTRAYIAANP